MTWEQCNRIADAFGRLKQAADALVASLARAPAIVAGRLQDNHPELFRHANPVADAMDRMTAKPPDTVAALEAEIARTSNGLLRRRA